MALPRLAAIPLRRIRRSTLPAVVISLVVALVAVACRDMVTDAALRPAAAARSLDISTGWTASGTGASNAPGSAGAVTLTYHDPGYTYGHNESWSWQRTADQSQTLDLDWTYNGFHRWYRAHAWLDIWSEDASGNVSHHQLVDSGTYDAFTFSGTIQLAVTAGHRWGVTATGYNYDITTGLDGSITLTPRVSPGSVQGVVTDAETGAALQGAQVSLVGTASSASSDGQGAFILQDVAAGSYTLAISAPGHLAFSAPVSVADGQATTRDAALVPLYAFSVLVTPDSAAGVLVTATDISSGEPLYQSTGEDGRAHFALLAGRYIFSARRVATADPDQLQVWPIAGGEVPVSGDLGAFAGAVYVSGAGSQILTPGNYHRAFRSPLDLNATSFAELGGQITLSLTPTATIGCTLLDADGNPIQGSGAQVFGTLPYADTSDLPPIPESFTGNRDLPRGLGYGVANVSDDGACALPGAPEGTTVLETPPIPTPDGPVVYRTSVDVSESDAQGGSTVEAVAGPQPQLSFTNYFTDEPWGDERGGNDIGGLITFGWKDATTSTFVVTSGFRGLGTYSLELFTSDPGADVGSKDAAVRVSVVCSAKRCKMLPSAPKPPKGTTATGVSIFSRGDSQGTLVWQVPLPGNPDTIWLRITTSGKSDRGDQTVVLPAVRQPGNGNSYVIMAGS